MRRVSLVIGKHRLLEECTNIAVASNKATHISNQHLPKRLKHDAVLYGYYDYTWMTFLELYKKRLVAS